MKVSAEDKYGSVVYMVVCTFLDIGKIDFYLYVSDYREEWECDNEDIKNWYPWCMSMAMICPAVQSLEALGLGGLLPQGCNGYGRVRQVGMPLKRVLTWFRCLRQETKTQFR